MADRPSYSLQIQLNHPILDPHLTPLGRSQASKLGSALQREIKGRGMPIPEKWFVSPLHRVGETCRLEWDWLFPDQHGVPAFVVEVSVHFFPSFQYVCHLECHITSIRAESYSPLTAMIDILDVEVRRSMSCSQS